MPLALISHPAGFDHQPPEGHPERPDRLRALEALLARPEYAGLDRHQAARADDALLRLAHAPAYVAGIRARAPATGTVQLDPDTWMSPGTLEAALRAAGGAAQAVDLVMAGPSRIAFSAQRPPGHHAEPDRAMGFCLFANAAIAARHALAAHGLTRVAVADFDVHHGNGTQAVVWDDPRVAFASSHQMPLWPGSGAAGERGAGNVFNAPLPPGAGGAEFRRAWEDVLLPALDAHRPELIVISAGFDAHAADPLAQLELQAEDFAWITGALCDLAAAHAGGRVVSVLEGGYSLSGLTASVEAHLQVLMERAA